MPTLAHKTERDLLLLSSTGDAQAFTEIFHRYKHKLFGAMVRLTGSAEQAEDIVQEVFMKLWDDRARLPEIENINFVIKRYLFKI